jgi:Glycosyl hydrolases family 18
MVKFAFESITKRNLWSLIAIAIAFSSLLVVGLMVADNLTFDSRYPLTSCCANKDANGLWIRYLYYSGESSADDLQALVSRLDEYQIRYAYFHVLSATKSGALQWHHPENAQKITMLVHKGAPQCKALAWIYVGSSYGGGSVDLSSPQVRQKLVDEAKWLTETCGFDGVQWDYEFCQNGDQGLLKLITETKKRLAPEKIVSVATPMWYPGTLWGWHQNYFRDVADRADQIAVMCYDSYQYFPSAYIWLVEQQCVHILEASKASTKKCKIIFGLPTYEDVTLAHYRNVENLLNALRGMQQGLKGKRATATNLEGIALFADYTTDEREWDNYQRYWLDCDDQ